MSTLFHVTSALNRASIQRHGLDVTRMGAARGIAGSTAPEADGVFLCADFLVDFFVGMNNTGGSVDVWQVEDVDTDAMIDNGNGFEYLPGTVPAERLTLQRRDLPGGDLNRGRRG